MDENLFWMNVDIRGDDECWNWKGYINRDGYGNYRVEKHLMNAHRIAYMIKFGDIEKGMCVCHKCDNPSCANPNHLFLGTHSENMKDCAKKKRIGVNKISKEQVLYILSSDKNPKELAKELNVTGRAIAYRKYKK